MVMSFSKAAAHGAVMWIGVIAVAAVIRLHGLELRSLWHDEAMSFAFSGLGPLELTERLRLDSGPPLYYLVLHAWTSMCGESVAALRSLSAVLGVLLVAAVGAAGAAILGSRAGLAAALVCAVSPSAVYFSQEARGYALLSVTVLVSWTFLLRLGERGGTASWAIYCASASAALLTHNYAFFVIGAQGLWVAARRNGRFAVQFGAALGFVAVIYFPWLPVFLDQLGSPTPVRWMEDVWKANGPFGSLWASLRGLSPGGILPDPIGSAAIATTVGVLAFAAAGLARRQAVSGGASWLLLSSLGPLILADVYSSIRSPVYVPGRLDQVTLPAFCLAWGLGLSSIRMRPLRLAAATMTVGAALLTVAAPRVVARAAEDQQLAAVIVARAEPGDLVIATSLTRPTLEYYLRERVDLEIRSYPAELARHLGNLDMAALLENPGVLGVEAEGIAAQVATGGRTAWVAHVPDPVNDFLVSALRRRKSVIVEEEGTFRMTVLAHRVILLRAASARGAPSPVDGQSG